MRNLHIHGKIFQYKVGKWQTVVKFPTGEKATFSNTELTGRDSWTFEKGQYKGTSDGMVKPSHIKSFLLRLLEGGKVDTERKTGPHT